MSLKLKKPEVIYPANGPLLHGSTGAKGRHKTLMSCNGIGLL